MKRTWKYGTTGAFLAFGAPLGWLVIQGGPFMADLTIHPRLYVYMWIGTSLAFAVFGAYLGRLADRLEAANRRLTEMALVDRMTGLKNMRYFEERLTEETARTLREKRSLALIMADLDHFKKVNDTYGHPVGDEVLGLTGKAILSSIRSGDSACRVGGEEFAVLCPELPLKDALTMAERIREAVSKLRVETPGGPVNVTISLGVAVFPPCQTGKELVKASDDALYKAKGLGRNRVETTQSE